MRKEKKVNKDRKNKKKVSWKIVTGFILFQIIFAGITGPLLVYYGPFEKVTKGVVGGLQQTMTKGWINKIFLSDEEIDNIMGKNSADEDEEPTSNVDIKVSKDRTEEVVWKELKLNTGSGYVLEVDPRSIKIGVTSKLEVAGEPTSEIAERNGAIAAVNGGGFLDSSGVSKYAGTGSTPTGIVIQDGKIVWAAGGDDVKHVAFGFDKNGVMNMGKFSANEMIKMGIVQGLSFNDDSIILQNKVVKKGEPGLNPRTAIGQREDGTVVLVVVDGRNLEKMELGISTGDLAKVMRDSLGVVNAFNLDGGKSTTMYYEGGVVNDPSELGGERSIPTAVMVVPDEG